MKGSTSCSIEIESHRLLRRNEIKSPRDADKYKMHKYTLLLDLNRNSPTAETQTNQKLTNMHHTNTLLQNGNKISPKH